MEKAKNKKQKKTSEKLMDLGKLAVRPPNKSKTLNNNPRNPDNSNPERRSTTTREKSERRRPRL